MKEAFLGVFTALFVLLGIIFAVQTICGIEDAGSKWQRENGYGCYTGTHTRFGKVFPAYSFGCWLGEPLETK